MDGGLQGTLWLVLTAQARAPLPRVRVSPREGARANATTAFPSIRGEARPSGLVPARTRGPSFDARYVVQAEDAPEDGKALTPKARAAVDRIFAALDRPVWTHVVMEPSGVELAVPLTAFRPDRIRAAAIALAALASHAEAAVGAGPLARGSPPAGAD